MKINDQRKRVNFRAGYTRKDVTTDKNNEQKRNKTKQKL